jgi:hypothetical protein
MTQPQYYLRANEDGTVEKKALSNLYSFNRDLVKTPIWIKITAENEGQWAGQAHVVYGGWFTTKHKNPYRLWQTDMDPSAIDATYFYLLPEAPEKC